MNICWVLPGAPPALAVAQCPSFVPRAFYGSLFIKQRILTGSEAFSLFPLCATVNLKKASMASRNIVAKKPSRSPAQLCSRLWTSRFWYSARDDYLPWNLGKTIAQECKNSNFGWRALPKNGFAFWREHSGDVVVFAFLHLILLSVISSCALIPPVHYFSFSH